MVVVCSHTTVGGFATSVDFGSYNDFANLSSFAKVSVPVVSTGTETFAREPEFEKLLRGLKLTLVSYNKKGTLVVVACL